MESNNNLWYGVKVFEHAAIVLRIVVLFPRSLHYITAHELDMKDLVTRACISPIEVLFV